MKKNDLLLLVLIMLIMIIGGIIGIWIMSGVDYKRDDNRDMPVDENIKRNRFDVEIIDNG